MQIFNSACLPPALVACAIAVCSIPAGAEAAVRGQRTITANTRLTDDQYGGIVFGADGIVLDCDNHQVHISSASKDNCYEGQAKCGIVAIGRERITIRNCEVVGGDYRAGVYITDSAEVILKNVQSSSLDTSFYLVGNSFMTANKLWASSAYYAFDVLGASQSSFTDVRIMDVTWGVYSTQSNFVDWSHLSVIRAEQTGYFGIDDVGVKVVNSAFAWNGTGYQCRDCTFGEIRASYILDGTRAGIVVEGSSDVSVISNTAFRNGSCDAMQSESADGYWSDNDFYTTCGSVPADY